MKEIQLSKHGKNKGRYVALVDDEDYEYLNQFNWYAHKDQSTYYARRNVKINNVHTVERMHWVVMGRKWVDHINHNGLDNQRHNLRECTKHQNLMNRRPERLSASKYKGVSIDRRQNRWASTIGINGKKEFLGRFTDEISAAKAYDARAKVLYGEFAWLNFPDDLSQGAFPIAPVSSPVATTVI